MMIECKEIAVGLSVGEGDVGCLFSALIFDKLEVTDITNKVNLN